MPGEGNLSTPSTKTAHSAGAVRRLIAVIALAAMLSMPAFAQDEASPTAQPAPGTVLIDERFDDPQSRTLPASSPSPGYRLAYEDGEYVIEELSRQPGLILVSRVPITGSYRDASLAVDIRLLADDPTGQYVGLECRSDAAFVPGDRRGYEARLDLVAASFTLLRWAENRGVSLLPSNSPLHGVRPPAEPNRIEFNCTGNTIALSVNGLLVAAVPDATPQDEGAFALAFHRFSEAPPVSVRLDNLRVTQTGPS